MLLPLISRAFNIKNKPGSHFYVDNVTTTDSGYIDLGFFTHPQEASYKYFMVVNRDGIAWMDTAVITVTLHFSNMQKVTVTNIADLTVRTPQADSIGYFTLVDTFAPGEGKLYKVEI